MTIAKNYLTGSFFLMLMFHFACQKTNMNDWALPQYNPSSPVSLELKKGWMEYKYNGSYIRRENSLSYIESKNEFHLIMRTHYPDSFLSESLWFGEVPLQGGKHVVEQSTAVDIPYVIGSITVDYDQSPGTWMPDTLGFDNYITVSDIDTVERTVRGIFQARLIHPLEFVSSTAFWYYWPDTIELTEGRYYLEY